MNEIYQYILLELKGLVRFRWLALAVAAGICVLGWVGVLSLPDVYQAQARVYVDTSSRLRDVLGRIAFQPDLESRVALVRQAMLGRPQMEKVAQITGLDQRARNDSEFEELIDELMLNVQVFAARNNPALYTIIYRDQDRQMALAVVGTIVQGFVEDVLQGKEDGSNAAESFLMDQIEHYSNQLAASESRLAEFKKENVGLMPGESGDYFARFQSESDIVDDLNAQLQIAISRRDELERQINDQPQSLPAGAGSAFGTGPQAGTAIEDPTAARIRQLQTSLGEMLLKYTENHPDVIATREQIASLQAQREADMQALRAAGQPDAALMTNPVYQSISMALNEARVQIAALRGQIADRTRRVEELRQLIDTAPEVEAELARLNRDYGNTRAMYDQLLGQLERERLVNEGDDRSVISFQQIDPPQASQVPVSPKRGFLLLAVTAVAFGIGGALAYVMSQLRPVIFDPNTLVDVAQLPVLGQVSRTWRERTRWRRRTEMVSYSVSVACLLVCFGVLLILRHPSSQIVRSFWQTLAS